MSLYAFKLSLGNHRRVGQQNNLFGTTEILQARLYLPLLTHTESPSAPHGTAVQQADIAGLSSCVCKILTEKNRVEHMLYS